VSGALTRSETQKPRQAESFFLFFFFLQCRKKTIPKIKKKKTLT
jgi:hypothetical protein